MTLTKEIIEKYNKLHREVAEYYGLQDKIQNDPKCGLDFIHIDDMGYNYSDKHPYKVFDYLQFAKAYLSDFFKIYHHMQFQITKRDFDMINYSVKKIRKEKLQNIRNK